MGEFTHAMRNPIRERDDRIAALEESVTRLKEREADLVKQNVALMGQNGRLQLQVERLPGDHEADAMFDVLQPSLGTPVPPERRIRRQADVDAAFARGVEAMRAAAVAIASKRANLQRLTDSDMAWGRSAECILDELRHLTVTEDKP